MEKFLFFSLVLSGIYVQAQSVLDVHTTPLFNGLTSDSSSLDGGAPLQSDNFIEVDIQIKCAGTNLRGVINPIARNAVLVPKISIHTVGATPRIINYSVFGSPQGGTSVIPTSISSWSGSVDHPTLKICKDGDCTTDNGATGRAYRAGGAFGLVQLKLPVSAGELPDFWNSTSGFIEMPVVTINFDQVLTFDTWAEFMGHTGAITAYNSAQTWDPNGRKLTVNAVFFGEEGYCGGFHSPLVLFFDNNNRPQYKNIARFDATNTSGAYFWPEKSSQTYFLALDKNKNGRIDKTNELFGNLGGGGVNGFEALKVYDVNADGVIDKKDEVFSKLLLWQDSTGKAKCLKKDLYTLEKMGVESISLKYKNALRSYNGRAEERQEASFQYKKEGKLVAGEVIDVWLSLANSK